jgi:hypothetical protein
VLACFLRAEEAFYASKGIKRSRNGRAGAESKPAGQPVVHRRKERYSKTNDGEVTLKLVPREDIASDLRMKPLPRPFLRTAGKMRADGLMPRVPRTC